MCRVLRVSRSGFYAWLRRDESARARRDRELLVHIRAIHQKSRGSYGSPRVTKALAGQPERCNHKRIERLMREAGIRAVHRRKFRVTTHSDHDRPVAENILGGEFSVPGPDRAWVADLTYVWTEEGWLYLAAVMDLWSRRILGWSMSERMTQGLVVSALEMAVRDRRPGIGLLHHSDRGSQYASAAFQEMLRTNGIVCSMSRRGRCYDNAVMESFFHTLKIECVYQARYATRAEARRDIFEYIEGFYNSWRLHSSLGYLSPAAFEAQAQAVA
jgi:transposase InsO family protein